LPSLFLIPSNKTSTLIKTPGAGKIRRAKAVILLFFVAGLDAWVSLTSGLRQPDTYSNHFIRSLMHPEIRLRKYYLDVFRRHAYFASRNGN
jgi:hypothetical protein